jgi:transcriptional regulator with XRE-family HTH domain
MAAESCRYWRQPGMTGKKRTIMDLQFLTPEELAMELGSRIRRLRIQRNLEQVELAARAGVSVRTLRSLETGKGSTVETLLRVLKALDALDSLEALAPVAAVRPLALLKSEKPRQRVRKPRGERP